MPTNKILDVNRLVQITAGKMPHFSLLTFDCYGTLIDWESGIKNALRNLPKKRNLSFDIESLPQRYIEIELEIEKEGYRKYREVLEVGVRRLLKRRASCCLPKKKRYLQTALLRGLPLMKQLTF